MSVKSLGKQDFKEDTTYPNNLIKIGKNASGNDELVRLADQNDIWFHLANLPSCHVILECAEEFPVTKEMITYCANLTKANTKYRYHSKLKVTYTEIKNIKRTETLGKVTIGKSNKIVV